jgi:hypothetical protein
MAKTLFDHLRQLVQPYPEGDDIGSRLSVFHCRSASIPAYLK